jgi:hypothetical protein
MTMIDWASEASDFRIKNNFQQLGELMNTKSSPYED